MFFFSLSLFYSKYRNAAEPKVRLRTCQVGLAERRPARITTGFGFFSDQNVFSLCYFFLYVRESYWSSVNQIFTKIKVELVYIDIFFVFFINGGFKKPTPAEKSSNISVFLDKDMLPESFWMTFKMSLLKNLRIY